MYKHVQFGWLMLVTAIIVMISGFFMPTRDALYVSSFLVLVILVFFITLKVEVDQDYILVSFGIGLIRKRINLDDVTSCKPIKIKWWWGWGIHGTPGKGWLWNVSGLGCVQLDLKGKVVFLIGSDEPEKLSMAIQEKLSQKNK